MKDLLELVQLVTPAKLNNIQWGPFGPKSSKLQTFYDLTVEGKFKEDEDAALHFYAKDKLTFAATAAKHHIVDPAIAELETRLDPRQWIRIHRSTLLHLEHVKELHTWFGGRVMVRLKDGKTELQVARDRTTELKERLGL